MSFHLLWLLLLSCAAALAAENNCQGTTNTLPVVTDAPTLVKSIDNGQLYRVGTVEPALNLVVVKGTAREMGLGIGMLMKDAIQELIPDTYDWIAALLEEELPNMPEDLADLIATEGANAALDWQWTQSKPFTPQHFIDEMEGLAAGAEVPYIDVVRIAMLPELIQAACSEFGAWGDAVPDTESLVVLRALDWDTNGPFQKFPAVIVHQPTDGGHAFANIGWPGLTGSLAGYSPRMAICEKVWIHYNGTSPHQGYPWTFVLQDILQFDENTADALDRIENAQRTASIFLGLADATSETFSIWEYSYEYVIDYQKDAVTSAGYPNHTYWPNLPFVDKHTQPSSDPCMNDLLTEYYGKLTPQVTLEYITSQFQTGDMMAAIYDYAENAIYVSNAGLAQDNYTVNGQPAYDRQWTRIAMADYLGPNTVFAQQKKKELK